MANLSEAVEQVKSLARTFEAVINLANALGDIASIETANNEAQTKLVNSQLAIADAENILSNLTTEAGAVKAQTDAAIATARQVSSNLVSEAQDIAEVIVSDANQHCEAVVKEAEKNRAEIVLQAQDLVNQCEASKAELDDIEARINRARSKVTEILQG